MPGTAAGARKGWKTKRRIERDATSGSPAAYKRNLKRDPMRHTPIVEPGAGSARAIEEVAGNMLRLAEFQEAARARSAFVPGLNIQIEKINEEYVPELADLLGRLGIYGRMANDAKIQAQLRANTLPLQSAVRWSVVGGTQEQRDLVSQNILGEGDPRYWCETSWSQRLAEKLMSLQNGFTIHGKTWDVVDGYRILRGLTYLEPHSLGGPLGPWEFTKDGTRLVALHRHYRLPWGEQIVDERIPIDDLDVCVFNLAGSNFEGTALIRSMYGAWKKKDLASKIAMIALMNGGVGIPMGTLGPQDGPVQQVTLKTQAQDLRGGSKERQFLILANGQKMEFLTTNGQIVDASPIISEQNMDIASGGTTDFMQTNQTSSGSRAGGSVMMVSYMQALEATNQWLQDQVNRGSGYLPGIVEELQYANFDNPKELARIVGSCVSPTDQLDNLPLLGELTQKGVIPRSLKIANAALDRLGYPAMTQAEYDLAVGGRSVVDIGTPSGQPEAQPGQQPAKVPGNGGAGRPTEVPPVDGNNPRKDKLGRAFGLTDTPAEKKSPDAVSRRRRNPAWPWITSTPV